MNVSVIIPIYNASAFLKKAVKSAVELEEVKEIFLIEDGSTDNSLEVCKILETEYPKVHLLQHPDKKNHGAGKTRNLGLEKATQEFIAFLDADDYYLPNRFKIEKEILKNPTIEGVFNAIGTDFLSDKGKKEFKEKFTSGDLTTVKHHAEGREVFHGLLGIDKTFGTFFHLNGLTVRRETIRKNNLQFNEKLRVHQDSDFIIKLSYTCYLKSGSIIEAVAMRGVHDDNRITKIKNYSSKYYYNNFLLQHSLWSWSKEKKLERQYSNLLKLQYVSFKTANLNGIEKYLYYFSHLIANPKLLKTRYRFNAFNRHQND